VARAKSPVAQRLDCGLEPAGSSASSNPATDHLGPGSDSKDIGFSHYAWSAGAAGYREFFCRRFDRVRSHRGSAADSNRADFPARLEVQNLIREIGLVEDEAPREIGLEMAGVIQKRMT
jgi:hypothetical protein